MLTPSPSPPLVVDEDKPLDLSSPSSCSQASSPALPTSPSSKGSPSASRPPSSASRYNSPDNSGFLRSERELLPFYQGSGSGLKLNQSGSEPQKTVLKKPDPDPTKNLYFAINDMLITLRFYNILYMQLIYFLLLLVIYTNLTKFTCKLYIQI